ncbi:MAG TPA: dipeptide epimerase [Chitinophagales bacterium]|nr:dipeptide epimerase [Chitinophagales bacterium]
MKISLHPYQLQFKYPFRIAHGLRTHTDVVYVKLQHEGFTAWGEAALPPYLSETQKSVIDFLSSFSANLTGSGLNTWVEKLNNDTSPNVAAEAALDMALWSLQAQIEGKTIGALLGIQPAGYPVGTYTLGVSSFNEMKLKIAEAESNGFQFFKLKLNGENDGQVIKSYKQLSAMPFMVDVNQGWKNLEEATRKVGWLATEGCLAIEQPLPVSMLDTMPALKKNCPLPLYADENCWNIADLEKLQDGFDGINMKLMKCGGISKALPLINKAREIGFKVLIGCMSESSVGCTAASYLTPLATYADLDGPYLIVNDPFTGMKVQGGHIKPHTLQQFKAV